MFKSEIFNYAVSAISVLGIVMLLDAIFQTNTWYNAEGILITAFAVTWCIRKDKESNEKQL